MKKLLETIELTKNKILNYKMDTPVGTKKMREDFHQKAIEGKNNLICEEENKISLLRDNVFEALEKRFDNIIPSFSIKDNNLDELNELKSKIVLNDDTLDIIHRSGLLQIDAMFDDFLDNDLGIINGLITKYINKYKKMGINLSVSDFNYSIFTSTYMNSFFEYYLDDDFNNKIKDVFDKVYWECPNITVHLKLCFRDIYDKYFKIIKSYVLSQNSFNSLINNYNDMYSNYISYNYDTRVIIERFFNDELKIVDFLDDSMRRKTLLDKFLESGTYSNLSDDGIKNYYDNIFNLNNTLIELNNFNKFKGIIDLLVEKFNKRNGAKKNYDLKLKEISKENGNRIKYIKAYNKNLKPGMFSKYDESKDKKYKSLINDSINRLDSLYNELDDLNLLCKLEKLDDSSTIYDLLKVGYNEFKFSDNNVSDGNNMSDLFEFIYCPNNTFINQISISDINNVHDIVFKKCDLLNIKINREDLDNLDGILKELDDILVIYYINNSKIDFNTINQLYLINNIKKTVNK